MVKGKRFLVVGGGKSGISVARFLLRRGALVTLTDNREKDKFNGALDELIASGVVVELGRYPDVEIGSYDFLVVSPGVPLGVAPVESALKLGLPVIGEVELAYCFARAPIVAITGTNGKTTTTALLGQIYQAAGLKTLVGGNIGLPLVDLVEDYGPEDIIVAEVSSFQLETARTFRPKVAVITNITPDHLDRHGTMETYANAKANIFTRQDRTDFTILNYDDDRTRALAGLSQGQVIFFSRRHILKEGVFVHGERVKYCLAGKEHDLMGTREIAMPGLHNLENSLAAAAAALVSRVEPAVLAGVLKTFPGVAHRLETVAEHNGIRYVNDSKGTNPEASMKALEAFNEPIVLLAGGRNKGSDFTAFTRLAKERVRVLVVLGECAGEIEAAARRAGMADVLRAPGGFNDAVVMAHRAARPGEVVLLSPACASWDMFNNYEERGELFRRIVNDLIK